MFLSVGNLFKTCIKYVDLGKAFPVLNRVAISIEDILKYHKMSFDTPNTLVIRKDKMFFLSVFHDQTSVESL